jgi:hypothetical protein
MVASKQIGALLCLAVSSSSAVADHELVNLVVGNASGTEFQVDRNRNLSN